VLRLSSAARSSSKHRSAGLWRCFPFPKDEVINTDLGMKGVGIAILVAEKLNHWGLAHAATGIFLPAFFQGSRHRFAVPLILISRVSPTTRVIK